VHTALAGCDVCAGRRPSTMRACIAPACTCDEPRACRACGQPHGWHAPPAFGHAHGGTTAQRSATVHRSTDLHWLTLRMLPCYTPP